MNTALETAMSGIAIQPGMHFLFSEVVPSKVWETKKDLWEPVVPAPLGVRGLRHLSYLRDECVGFIAWEKFMNVSAESDPEVSLHFGAINNDQVYWVEYRGFCYVWVEKGAVLRSTIAKKVERVISMNVSVKAPDPRDAIIPLCVTFSDLDEWGCPSCGYAQGVIGQAKEGTAVWICRCCGKPAHVVVPQLSQSTIPAFEVEEGMKPFFPKVKEHPRKGMAKKAL